MQYYFSKTINLPFNKVVENLKEVLPTEGFGVVTEMDVSHKLKEKINVDFRPYLILGTCNPQFAHAALQEEDKLGTILPCNFMVQQKDDGQCEVAAINPEAAMQAIDNPKLHNFASEVSQILKRIIDKL